MKKTPNDEANQQINNRTVQSLNFDGYVDAFLPFVE